MQELRLHLAAGAQSCDEIYTSLLRARADANARDQMGRVPLHHAVVTKHVSSVRALVKATRIDAQNSLGWTVLHSAAKVCSEDITKILAENKANVNIQDCEGRTPLHIAAIGHESESTIALLLLHGADPGLVTKRGCTALQLATRTIIKGSGKQGVLNLLQDAMNGPDRSDAW